MVTWVTQHYSDAKSRGNIIEMSGNFTVLGERPANEVLFLRYLAVGGLVNIILVLLVIRTVMVLSTSYTNVARFV